MDVRQVMTSSWVGLKVALIMGYSITAAFQGSKPELLVTHESCYVFFIDRKRENVCVTTPSDAQITYVGRSSSKVS